MELLFENDDFWVWNKPSGWHSVTGKQTPSAEDFLAKKLSIKLPESGLLHRLDQLTSGCLAAAKNLKSYERLRRSFRENSVQKTYWALVEKDFPPQGEFELYFDSNAKSSTKIKVSGEGHKKSKGCCRWQKISEFRDGLVLEVQLIGPGRRHQIRAGLAYTKSPLIGDELYGGSPEVYFGLHARSLEIEGLRVECPSPQNWPQIP